MCALCVCLQLLEILLTQVANDERAKDVDEAYVVNQRLEVTNNHKYLHHFSQNM